MRYDPSLFRPEAINASQEEWIGSPSLTIPLSYKFWSLASATIIASIIAIGYLGQYTKTMRLQGVVANTAGPVTIYSPGDGVITEIHFVPDSRVRQGDNLFTISTDTTTSEGNYARTTLDRIQQELSAVRRLSQLKRTTAEQAAARTEARLFAIGSEVANLNALIVSMNDHREMLSVVVEQQRSLFDRRITSQQELLERELELHGAVVALANAQRDLSRLEAEIKQAQVELDAIPTGLAVDLAELQRTQAQLEQQKIATARSDAIIITASVTGTIATQGRTVGAAIVSSQPLASIQPDHGSAVVDFDAPSEAIGMIAVGDDVLLRFDSFPHQRFGQPRASIISIAEWPTSQSRQTAENDRTTSYRVRTDLPIHGFNFDGALHPIRTGMQVDGFARLETRRLYEWLLLPTINAVSQARNDMATDASQ